VDDYSEPRKDLAVIDTDGQTWRRVDIYTHKTGGNVVLWYHGGGRGENSYEGLEENYRLSDGVLRDSDDCIIQTKPISQRQPAPAKASGTTGHLSFEDAHLIARGLGLASQQEWAGWCKRGNSPPNMPREPNKVYKGSGWPGWYHWLGVRNKPKAGSKSTALQVQSQAATRARARVYVCPRWQAWRGHCPKHFVSSAQDQRCLFCQGPVSCLRTHSRVSARCPDVN